MSHSLSDSGPDPAQIWFIKAALSCIYVDVDVYWYFAETCKATYNTNNAHRIGKILNFLKSSKF